MKKYKLKKKPCILLVFSISILFLFTFNVTSSRYMGELEGTAEDIVAIPIISLDNPTFTYTNKKMLPGDVDESDFFVSNYDKDNKTNEVLMKYYLKVTLDSEIPVKVTLTDKDGKELKLLDDKRTEEYELPYDEMMKTKYHIKIEWDKKDNNYEYAGKDISLTIDLIAIQVVDGDA